MIPSKLRDQNINFVLLKTKEKIPFEKEWQKKEIKWDDEKLNTHISNGGNYGVMGGMLGDDIGLIIETPGFIPYYSGLKNLKYLDSLRKKITTETIIENIKKVGLDPTLKKSVKKYSMGMRQRLAIAQAIMEDPSLLVLDEPMNGLDKQGIADVRSILLKLKDEGKTILLTSHNHEDIDLLCDSVYEMDGGVMEKISNK